MSKIARAVMKIFGSTAGPTQIGKFGSFAAGLPVYTQDPTIVQALPNYLGGWYDAVDGENSPCIQDMNALCFLFAYQLAYLMQTGVPEWNAATTYYIGSLVNNGSGVLYKSITDNNINHALTDVTNWAQSGSAPTIVSSGPVTVANGSTYFVDTTAAAITFNLPASPSAGFNFTVIDTAGKLSVNAITIHRAASEQIEGLAADYVCSANYGSWKFNCSAVNWFIQS